MRVTLGENDGEAATGNAATGPGTGEHPDLARARDGHRTPKPGVPDDTLPVTERDDAAGVSLGERLAEARQMIWSGEVWDIQPPAPRELVDRACDGDWWVHEAFVLRVLARVGAAACVLWSIPLYTLAVLGQRPGRAITALLVAGLIWYLT